jgi:nucleotide-binding universal stress UspA family protein
MVHDAIVLGCDCNFRGITGGGPARMVEQVLRRSPRPIIVAPPGARDPSRANMIAYDGSNPAARALQIFTLLDLGRDSEVHVLSIDSQQGVADRWANEARAYLALHGVSCKPHAVASSADPSDLVVAEARVLGADLVVMGAYGRRGWRESLLGSFTTRMLSQCPTNLFVHQ